MKKLLFGNDVQARAYAEANNLILDKKPTPVNLAGFQSEEGAPETFLGECNAFVARDAQGNIVAYLAFWETLDIDDIIDAIRQFDESAQGEDLTSMDKADLYAMLQEVAASTEYTADELIIAAKEGF